MRRPLLLLPTQLDLDFFLSLADAQPYSPARVSVLAMARLLRRAPALNFDLPRLLLVLRCCHARCSCCVASLCHLAADAVTAELEAAKRAREAADTDLRGSQLQASIAASTIQALEATIAHLQEEITKVGSQMENLKSKEDGERDEFISQMLEMNARIRQFPQMASVELARNSELSADGKQGKATDSNQSTATDGDGTAASPPTSELQQPGRKPPRINGKFAILVDVYIRPTARRRQDRPCGAMAAA